MNLLYPLQMLTTAYLFSEVHLKLYQDLYVKNIII